MVVVDYVSPHDEEEFLVEMPPFASSLLLP